MIKYQLTNNEHRYFKYFNKLIHKSRISINSDIVVTDYSV